jgi:asparagine synthase (glutamine-hydrolysing)
MCGIAGIYAYRESAPPVDSLELLRIRDHMERRGPDGAGLWLSEDGRVGLAHRRLAIIDLSETGAQPMASADGRYQVTFNGEIYNYRELRRELEGRGFVFRSQSDTEVLLHLYADRGERMVEVLRGMFAFGLWDSVARTLFLARDPFGIKPLYYANDGQTFRFASQVKALLAANEIDTAPEPAGLVGFLLMGSVPEPFTLYRNIRSLPAGSTMMVSAATDVASRAYFDVREMLLRAQDIETNSQESAALLREAVRDSVRAHLVSDVPVGIFLSAGIDSGTIAGLASEEGDTQLRAVTLGFREFRDTADDEVPLAREVARHYGIPHRENWIERRDFESELPSILAAMDQPSIDGVNTYLVSRAAARSGMKVALSGLGGDELLGGYPSFRQVPQLVRLLGWTRGIAWAGAGIRRMIRGFSDGIGFPKFAGVFEYGGTYGRAYLLRRSLFMPWELRDLLDPVVLRAGAERLALIESLEAMTAGIRSPRARVAALEMAWYMRNQLLRDADWAGMAHSLEIRVPLVDVRFFEAVAPAIASSLPPTKATMVRTPLRALPGFSLRRAKTGFSTPVRNWIGSGTVARERGLRGWALHVTRDLHTAQLSKAMAAAPVKETILVYRTGQLGDTLVAIPAIRAIRAIHPGARVVLLTDRHSVAKAWVSSWDVLGPTGLIDDVLLYEPPRGVDHVFRTLPSLTETLRDVSPSIVYNLAPARKPSQRLRDWLFFVAMLRVSRYVTPLRRMERGIAPSEPEWHRLLAAISSDQGEFVETLSVPAEMRLRAATVFQTAGGSDTRPKIALAPGSKMSAKRWPQKRFISVVGELRGRFPEYQFIVLGDTRDAPLGDELADRYRGHCVNVAGQLSVLESAALLEQCSVYIGNDTGTMHLAAMVGCPCIAIFSARDAPGRWDPIGKGHVVLRSDPPCAGCMLEVCVDHGNKCLLDVSADQVIDAATAVLTAKHRTHTVDPNMGLPTSPSVLTHGNALRSFA